MIYWLSTMQTGELEDDVKCKEEDFVVHINNEEESSLARVSGMSSTIRISEWRRG